MIQSTLLKPEVNIIYFGDYLKNVKNIPDNSIDFFFSDPPFAIDFKKEMTQYNRNNGLVLPYHEISIDKYEYFCNTFIREVKRILKPTGNGCIISGFNYQRFILNALADSKLHLQNEIIWKYPFGVFTKHKFVVSHYPIFFFTKNKTKFYFKKAIHYFEDLLIINKEYWPSKIKTANKLPKELVELLIYCLSKENDIVVDFFCGSGTIPKVCSYMNRRYIGFEIMKETYDFILKRIKELDY